MVGTTLARLPRWGRRRPRWDGLTVLRLRRVGLSTRLHARAVVVTLALLAVTCGVSGWSLVVGDVSVPLADVLASLTGATDAAGDDGAFVVRTLRLPRALTAVLVGAGSGASGAIFQRVARNPLASPDVIGVNAGAAAAAVFVIVAWNGTALQVTVGALIGAVAASVAVYVLAYRQGITGYRFVLVGIGLTALLMAATHYLLTRAEIVQAQRATVWLTGSLNGRGWDHVRYVGVAVGLLLPAAALLARHLRPLELGDDLARGLGVRVEAARAGLILVGVALAAAGTAAAGPVGFVALVSPQIARRLVGARSLGLLPAAACGALLLAAADLAARRTFAPTELPAGVVTAVIGAPFLLYLLARANRIGAGG